MARRIKRTVSSPGEPNPGRILQRPDGYYWESKPGELRGPFESREEADLDRLAYGGADDGEFETGESLHEAESEIGVAEWIDPDTGDPAEDHIPRLEDH